MRYSYLGATLMVVLPNIIYGKDLVEKELVAVSNPNLMEQLADSIPESKFLFLIILFLVITSGLMITIRKMRIKQILQAKDWQSLQSSLDVNAYE